MFSLLTALFCALAACAKSHSEPQVLSVQGVQASDLPSGLTLPSFRGDASNVVEQMCDWVRTSQVPFPPTDVENVYVSSFHTSLPRDSLQADLISAALYDDDVPRRLIVWVEPTMLDQRSNLAPLREKIVAAGFWQIEKRNSDCGQDDIALSSSSTRCIRITRQPAAPSNFAIADYHDVAFLVSGPRVRQQFELKIITIRRGDRLVGRSIEGIATGEPQDGLHVDQVCTPHLFSLNFESL
ncbi:MAG TPA: hypothetical protein VHC73_14225 [Vitreimonas sp.]|jgi:hypothetical protein|nr:hypothetical protein [Vitreimonas sp.]